MSNYQEAFKYYKDMEKTLEERKLSYLMEDCSYKLYLTYKQMKDYENSILYLEQNNELKTIKYKDRSNEYSKYLINVFETKKKDKEIYLLGKKQNIMKHAFRVLCFLFIIISMFTYTVYKKNKEIKRLNKLFKNLSFTDSLTEVNNRRSLEDFLSENLLLYKDISIPISFIMIDIDYFKLYNDNYGHLNGDKILKRVAYIIKESCGKDDFVARYGGEEFIIIMVNSQKDKSIELAKKINKNIYESNMEHKYSYVSDRVTISCGITTFYTKDIDNYQDCIKKADEALYKSKQKGRNIYIYLD